MLDFNFDLSTLTKDFLAVFLLLFLAQVFGYLFSKLKLPKVIGEITAGIILGPSLFGYFFPEFWFFKEIGPDLTFLYNFGLVLLMLVSGFEFQPSDNEFNKKTILYLLVGATLIPLILSWFLWDVFDFSKYVGIKNNILALRIILGIAVSITSIPVISKIFLDLNILNTPFARLVLSVATIEDVLLYVLIAVVSGLVAVGSISLGSVLISLLITVIFFGFILLIVPKIIKYLITNHSYILNSPTVFIILFCFFFSATANLLNINLIFGAFLAGLCFSNIKNDKITSSKLQIKALSSEVFIPIYFAIVGLKLDFIHSFDPLFFLGFLVVSSLIKILGTVISTKLLKKDWLSSFTISIVMNARGGPGIVLASLAFQLGIISEVFFLTMVLTAILTSLFAGVWLNYLISRKLPLLS